MVIASVYEEDEEDGVYHKNLHRLISDSWEHLLLKDTITKVVLFYYQDNLNFNRLW